MDSCPQFPDVIRRKAEEYLTARGSRKRPRFFLDTNEAMAIDYGDVVYVDKTYYLITGYEREGRFGIDDEPKYWVKRAVDLETGESRILKLVFYENFEISLGHLKVTCYRNPEKEARVLELVRGDTRFMQGHGTLDEAGNLVRVIEIIRGTRLDKVVGATGGSHREYVEKDMLEILRKFHGSAQALGLLHKHGLKHGDVRRDHIYVETATGAYRWIDFDYDFYLPERPFALDLFGLGSILLYIAGRGNWRPYDVIQHPDLGEKAIARLTTDDLSLLFRDRIMNLKKLFPYIPDELNNILLHFSEGASVFYETVEEFTEDLRRYIGA